MFTTANLNTINFAISCVISGFRNEAAQNCALLSCYASSSGNLLPGGLRSDVVAELWEMEYSVGMHL
jgi:hypothetical protein